MKGLFRNPPFGESFFDSLERAINGSKKTNPQFSEKASIRGPSRQPSRDEAVENPEFAATSEFSQVQRACHRLKAALHSPP